MYSRTFRHQQETQTYQLCLRRKSLRCGPFRPRGSSGIMKWSSTKVNWSNLPVKRLRLATHLQHRPPDERAAPPRWIHTFLPRTSPLLNDPAPRVRGVHKVPQVVVGHDDPVRLFRQVEQEPEGAETGGSDRSGTGRAPGTIPPPANSQFWRSRSDPIAGTALPVPLHLLAGL